MGIIKQGEIRSSVTKVLCLFLGLVVSISYCEVSNGQAIDKVEYTLYDDFETGELFGWEQYPYAQDLGFDAYYFTHQTPTYQNSKYSLASPIQAHDAVELYQGFTRRLNMYTTGATRVKAAIYFQSDRSPDTLELSLGTFDGRRYLHTIEKPTANTWLELDIPVEDFKMGGQSLGSGEHIQVITVKATYGMVYYLYTYTILMDNFSINGERQRRFVGVAPGSTDFDMFDVSVLNKHYFSGDVLSLTTRAEGDENLRQVRGKLLDSDGKAIRDNIIFTRGPGREWGNGSIYRFTERDKGGQWELSLTGQTQGGSEVRWGFKFLVPVKRITGHPRLLFSDSELKERLSGEKSAVARRILDNAIKDTGFLTVNVDEIKEGEDMTITNAGGGPYSKTTVGFESYNRWLSPMSQLARVIESGSFRYAFTHDVVSGAKAKDALMKLCSFSKLNADWFIARKFWTYYPVGYTLKSIAYGYDLLYDLLSEQERAHVRKFIMDQGLKPFQRDMVEMNRMPSNMTNHIAVMVTGYGLAAMAIYGDDPETPYLEPYLSGILTKAKTFIERTYYADGSYGEPKSSYLDMATRDLVELLAVAERNFSINYSTTTSIGNWYKYPLQAIFSNKLIQVYGDADRHYNGFTQAHAEWFVKRTGNPYLYSYIKPYWESGQGGYLGYLWYRDDIKPVSRETLPESKVFSAQGIVMRSGWGDSSTVISTRTGPNSNHYHRDQGSFQVMTNKTELLTDPGIGYSGYYANLDYQIYNIQAIAHNVLLVDHDPESQTAADYDNGIAALRSWPRMIYNFTGKTVDVNVSDLTSVYKGKLSSYTRTLLYGKGGPLFLFDQVKSSSPEGHVYDWLFHAPQNENNKRSLSYSDQHVLIDRPMARLTIDVLEPKIASAIIHDRADNSGGADTIHTLRSFPESYIALSSAPELSEVNFVAVLYPEAKRAGGKIIDPVVSRISGGGWTGARVEHGEEVYYSFFRTGGDGTGNVAGFKTDASRFMVSTGRAGEDIETVYMEGTMFKYKELSIQSTEVVSCNFDFRERSIAAKIQTETGAIFSFASENRPQNITVDGTRIKGWQYNRATKMITLRLAPGTHELLVN